MEVSVLERPAWGKADRATGDIHLLVHHCADVGATFEALLMLPHFKSVAERLAGRALSRVDIARLTVLAFLHDVGKIHPEFQRKGWPNYVGGGVSHTEAGFEVFIAASRDGAHPLASVLRRVLAWSARPEAELCMILAHHGRPVRLGNGARPPWPDRAHYDWRGEAVYFGACLEGWMPEAFAEGPVLPDTPEFHHFIAGLLALADWIGSDRAFFPFNAARSADYFARARRVAASEIPKIGFGALPARAPSFRALTGFDTPNSAQETVGETPTDARLVIVEAETGSGKTEAALLRFVHLVAAGEVGALYFAVPTRAAAGQLHGRVAHAMRRFFGQRAPEAVLAIPGMIQVGGAQGWRAPGWTVRWDDGDTTRARWAAEHASRYLAATVAVGTVDQVMLSALQVGHAHARGAALSRALLVVDEVHASDAYMTAILRPLVTQHVAAGGHVLLMSATLGALARVAWTGGDMPDHAAAVALPYPAVWRGAEVVAAGGAGRAKAAYPELLADWSAERYAALAVDAAVRGARVLVIRNTVAAAVECFREVCRAGREDLLMQVAGQGALHHSRFAAEERVLLDVAAQAALAPDPKRKPGGCIVIGTQTLEQSLDIDADLLITDLCPMDVLLQRIGRLHRHNLSRPAGFGVARVLVGQPDGGLDQLVAPAFENGLGAWEKDGWNGIYTDLAAVELTRRLMLAHPVWDIPEMNRLLVEGATHPDPVAALIAEKGGAWATYMQKVAGADAAALMFAGLGLLDRSERFDRVEFKGSDERVMTRLGEEGALLDLAPGSIGAFGGVVSRIALPARWSAGITGPEATLEGGILTAGDKRFSYDVEGLGRIRVDS